jgi:hypothetical protein
MSPILQMVIVTTLLLHSQSWGKLKSTVLDTPEEGSIILVSDQLEVLMAAPQEVEMMGTAVGQRSTG